MHYLCFKITGQINKILKIREKGFKKALNKKIWGDCVCRDSTKYFFEKYIQKQNTSLSNIYASNI